jgi:hypothetical protein
MSELKMTNDIDRWLVMKIPYYMKKQKLVTDQGNKRSFLFPYLDIELMCTYDAISEVLMKYAESREMSQLILMLN